MERKINPVLISWNVTRACNLNCLHCYRDAGTREEDELTLEQGKKLIREIAQVGFKLIVLSGGEPLMREDIYELINYAKDCNLRVVLGTNGILITKDAAQKLKLSGTSRVGISLDSINEKSHDEFRMQIGAFRGALEGMKNCQEAGLEFQIHTTVRERNMSEIEEITDLAQNLKAKAHHIFFLVPTGRAANIKEEELKALEHEKLLRKIVEKQRKIKIELKPTCAPQFMRIAKQKGIDMRFSRGCLTGVSYCVIIPNGDVHPCPYLPIKIGNVKEKSFIEIWNDSEIFKALRTKEFGGRCAVCEYEPICGGCRARAYFHNNGDYLAEDHWCLYQPKALRKNVINHRDRREI
ncbi:MAG: putative heme d1 biosynthesis radical SAM protein NirJ2 [Armatimonadetes bacterium]|nr:putative heme d1 biosynthesis radical SAM protein NirJ2 [Armatimonadota bacterium]